MGRLGHMSYTAHELTAPVKATLIEQWGARAESFHDVDKREIIKEDTISALNNGRYTDAIINDVTHEFVALVGVIKAEKISCHKVMDIKLNPISNPDYRDEQEIGLFPTSKDVVGTIIAMSKKGFVDADNIKEVKVFGRGHDMKTIFQVVAEIVAESPIDGFTITRQNSWLVINQIQ